MNDVPQFILKQMEKGYISQEEAVHYLQELKEEKKADRNIDIAVIGTACNIPMSPNVQEYWENISNERNCNTAKPADKLLMEAVFKNPYYAEYVQMPQYTEEFTELENFVGAFIKDSDKFDAGFFGIPPREASYIDPEQRVFLQTAFHSIEDAGYCEATIRDTMTGVFVGKDGTNTLDYKYICEADTMRTSGMWTGILASRINYIYNLKGPAYVIDTACSSGLVAVHQACIAMMNGDCEMAIAGGISLGAKGVDMRNKFREMDESSENLDDDAMKSIVSDDNKVRSFDKKCSGTVFGEGCVVFMLKPLTFALKDHDHIYGIIKGSAINNDGASNGLTAPNPAAQEEVITEALKRAKTPVETINYVECHGTGTMIGDPIEVLGLSNAFSNFTDKKQFCGIGSVKTNIGHTVGAAGCASLLKVLLAMKNDLIPSTLYFTEPNIHIDFINSPLYVVDKNREWVRKNTPRRAGVSAFGFSGTNCHVIVEEPAVKLGERLKNNKEYVLCLSAKSEASLLGLMEDYIKYPFNDKTYNLADICYTSNIGRGHYRYRLALRVSSIEEINEKLNYVSSHGLVTAESRGIYYGNYRIVPGERNKHSKEEITEVEVTMIRQKNIRLEDTLLSLNGSEYEKALSELCRMYASGVKVDWPRFYEGMDVYKVPIPTYHFEKKSYWGRPKISKISALNEMGDMEEKHPLLKRTLVESKDESIYLAVFNLTEQWVLQEHTILGNHMISGTTFIELCIEALKRHFKTNLIAIRYVVFLKPLIATEQDGDIEVHVVVRNTSDGTEFSVISKRMDEDEQVVWDEHIKGTAEAHTEQSVMCKSYEEISADAKMSEFAVDVIQKTSSLGPRWRCCENMFKVTSEQEDIWYTEIRLPDEFIHDLEDGFRFHPSTLDTAINLVAFQVYLGADVYLPFSYKNLKIYSDLPQHFYSELKKIEKGNDSEVMTFYARIMDLNGTLLAEIEEYTIKKVSQLNNYYSNTYYGVRWVREEFTESSPVEMPEGNILIFQDASGIAEKFAQKIKTVKNKIYFVGYGEEFQQASDLQFLIGHTLLDYEKLLSSFLTLGISKVYHFGTIDFEHSYRFEELNGELNRGLYSLFYLTQAFIKHVPKAVDFVLVTDYAHNVTGDDQLIKPANTSFLALAKTTVSECTDFHYRCFDLDADTDLELIFLDILRKGGSFRAAYRNNNRYVEELRKIDQQKHVAMENSPIRPNGLYIITGGTGGLGLETAKNFSMLAPANICLIGRHKYPEREEWTEYLKKDIDKKACRLISYIQEIEKNGSRILLRYADTGNYDQMQVVIDDLKRQFENINGIVHCAGIAGDGFLFRKSMDQFNAVIRPKVYGAAILYDLMKEQSLDFFLLYSSIQTIFGGPGQGDYTAGNAFMDTFAEFLKTKGIKAIAINWPGWSETGMAVDYNVANDVTLFKQLETKIAINALNNLMLYGLNNVVPGELRIDILTKIPEEELPIRLSEVLKRKVKRLAVRSNTFEQPLERTRMDDEKLVILGKGDDEYTRTERIVALIYASVLRLEEIDIFESFNSMGGNSIIATEVLKVLNKEFNNSINITDLFSYTCVEEMAAYIDSLKENKRKKPDSEKGYDELLGEYESGNIDIDSMINYFSEENKS